MKAFKKYSDAPVDQRIEHIPLDWPWHEVDCTEEEKINYESNGFIVLSNEDYLTYKSEVQIANALMFAAYNASQIPKMIDERIQYYQLIAPKIIRNLFVTNTINGISTIQSDQMFDDYEDVLTRLKEGAFPTALRRLQFKRPGGFVTQQLIDSWTAQITNSL